MSRDYLSMADYALLRLDTPDNPMIVTALMVFETPLDIQRLKTHLAETLLHHKRFSQHVVLPRSPFQLAYWEDDPNFDLDQHIHIIHTPLPEDPTLLQEFSSRLMSLGSNFLKPLWDFFVLERYGAGSALLARLHHSIADGITLVKIMLSATQTSSEDDTIRQLPDGISLAKNFSPTEIVKSRLDRIRLRQNLKNSLQLGASAANAALALLFSPPDKSNLFKGQVDINKRAAWSAPIPLDQVKLISKTFGCTVNDVLLSTLSGALRRYYSYRDQTAEIDTLHSFVPVDLRRVERRKGVDFWSTPMSDVAGNLFGFAVLALPIGVVDPITRLNVISQSMDLLKASGEALISFWILNLLGIAPGKIEDLAARFWLTKGSAVMTNVPGPSKKLYLAGAPIKTLIGWVPQSGDIGLGVSIFSYNREVCLAIASDQALVPDPERIINFFVEEYQDLLLRAEHTAAISAYPGQTISIDPAEVVAED